MAEKRKTPRRFERAEPEGELSGQELEVELGEELPDRQAMSVIDANVAIPANPAVAASVLAGGAEGQEAQAPPSPGEAGQERGEERREP